jgi:copper oxidase (laccase) domain-containing protein
MTTTTISTSRRSSSDRPLSPARSLTIPRPHGPDVHVRWSVRADGDFHRTEVPLAELEPRRRALVDLPWTMLDEHHGVIVQRVSHAGEHDGADGDVAITGALDAVLGCWVGDCAPIVLIGGTSELAVVHAGWRGLAAGVIDVAVAAFGEPVVGAVLGPCIGPCCYEFGEGDLAAVASGVGARRSDVTATTREGTPTLDVPAAVRAALGRHGVEIDVLAGCTGCSFDGFSHRVRNERERHVVAAWQGSAA